MLYPLSRSRLLTEKQRYGESILYFRNMLLQLSLPSLTAAATKSTRTKVLKIYIFNNSSNYNTKVVCTYV